MSTRRITDPEVSSFQKRPCYRYIRHSDNVPALGSGSTTAMVKLFNPTGGWTWFIAEYDPETRQAFGLVKGLDTEMGNIDMRELVEFRGQYGLPIERDLHWTPCELADC